ncbi:MAG: hypothetical protein OEL53_00030 [Rhodospirillales bacterium]|nr:hypothetical protein [Rhodospirillales bacterium]
MKKSIGVFFIDDWADWEFGLLTGAIAEWFGGRTVSISPIRFTGNATMPSGRPISFSSTKIPFFAGIAAIPEVRI